MFVYRDVLRRDPGELRGIERAKRSQHLPTVLTKAEVLQILVHLNGTYGMMGRLLYGTGMRLMECIRLRVKDVDFNRGTITVRSGNGDEDRVTMLPTTIAEPNRQHLARLKRLYEQDREDGLQGIEVPNAFAVKSPNAGTSWPSQWFFPARTVSSTACRCLRRNLVFGP